jgi:hypothetical protein
MRPALVNGAVGAVAVLDGEAFAVGAFTVSGGKIVEIDILADPSGSASSTWRFSKAEGRYSSRSPSLAARDSRYRCSRRLVVRRAAAR